MAKFTNAFTTYDAKGNREILLDKIYNVDPLDTPVMSLIGRKSIAGRSWDWQTEHLPTANTTPQLEGFVVAPDAATPTARLTAVTMILSENATVGGSQQAADAAGKPEGELAHQEALKTKVLKLSQEGYICGAQAAVTGDAATARVTKGLEAWIQTNVVDAAGATLIKDHIEDMQEALYLTNGTSGVDTLVLSYANRRKVSQMDPRKGTMYTMKEGTLLGGGVSVYLGDGGSLFLVPSRKVTSTTALGINKDYAKTAYFRAFERFKLAKTADADTSVILSEFGVECSNEIAFAKIINLGA